MNRFMAILLFIACYSRSYGQQLNSYKIFKINQLPVGKNVTVGKYVQAHLFPNEQIKIESASPPQTIDIHLRWVNAKSKPSLYIEGIWSEVYRQVLVGGYTKKNKQKSVRLKQGSDDVILIRGAKKNSLSIPLLKEQGFFLYPDMENLRKLNGKVHIIITSNKAFKILKL